MRSTRWLFGLLLTVLLQATSYICDPPPGAPLCQFPEKIEVAFIGTATATNADPFRDDFATWYRFAVEEPLVGVAPDVTEIVAWVSLGSGRVETGRKYFVHAIRDTQTSRYRMMPCGNTRPVEEAREDIAYLHSRQAGTFRPYISGAVLRNYTGSRYKTESEYNIRGVEGASVILSSRGRHARKVVADEDGHFILKDVEPGQYLLKASAPGYVQQNDLKVSVPLNGCGVVQAPLFTQSSMRGIVLNHDGTPAADVGLGLIDVDPSFERPYIEPESDRTNVRGEFSFTNLPSGRFLLGVNIEDCERFPNAIPPTYYPGVTSRQLALSIELRPNQAINGVILRLPPPRNFRVVHVLLKWPGGAVANRSTVTAWLNKGTYHSEYKARNGILELRLMQGVDYWITAAARDQEGHWIYTDNYQLKAGEEAVSISLVSRHPEPQWHRAIYPHR